LSRGFGPAGYPTEPLVSYRINRQLSGWNPPPQVIRAFGAHDPSRTFSLCVVMGRKTMRVKASTLIELPARLSALRRIDGGTRG